MLEIMRHIHVFVTRYCYNLNNQVGVATRRGFGTDDGLVGVAAWWVGELFSSQWA